MSDPALECVVDASVAIKLFVVESLSEHADALFAQLAQDPIARQFHQSAILIDIKLTQLAHCLR
jgi:predicted nucleic acid-binding protein